MRSTWGKAAAAAAATALTAGAVIGGAGTASAAPAARTATCDVSGLRAALSDKGAGGQAGMSHEGKVLTLTNTTGRTCALRGYPGLQLENVRHEPVETHTAWGSTYFVPDPGKRTIYLRPGGTAEADLAWAHADAPTMVQAAYLRVTPPASRGYLTIPFAKTVTNGDLAVTAFAHSITIR